ncbi:MAG: hypothetical protein O7H39_16875 [Gammaproteobacteria bacterium]|nr:hypothetical protein [Gammaproteobacteria bacterium]
MEHVFEAAPSGRSKCRGCKRLIGKGETRFGERMPNPFADGEMTQWFHPLCAAYKRPEALLEAIAATAEALDDRERLENEANQTLGYPRLPRLTGAERASSGRARCRHCRQAIAKSDWRIPLEFFNDGMINAGGFIHATCAAAYFDTGNDTDDDTGNVFDRLLHFSEDLSDADAEDLRLAVERASETRGRAFESRRDRQGR